MIADKHYGAAIDGYTRHATPPVQAVPTLAASGKAAYPRGLMFAYLSLTTT